MVKTWLPRVGGEEEMRSYCVMGVEFQFGKMRKVLEMMVVVVAQ